MRLLQSLFRTLEAMNELTLIPISRNDKGNLVLWAIDDNTLAHTHLVFVDALRAEHFGLSDQIKNTWVECRKNGMTYREFFSNEAAILQDARLQPYKDNDGESWRRKETGQQWYGIVRCEADYSEDLEDDWDGEHESYEGDDYPADAEFDDMYRSAYHGADGVNDDGEAF